MKGVRCLSPREFDPKKQPRTNRGEVTNEMRLSHSLSRQQLWQGGIGMAMRQKPQVG